MTGIDGATPTMPMPPKKPIRAALSLRDYFAGQALAGLAGGGWAPGRETNLAAVIYRIADAMLLAHVHPSAVNTFSEREALLREAQKLYESRLYPLWTCRAKNVPPEVVPYQLSVCCTALLTATTEG